MDSKRIILVVGLALLGFVVFTQAKNLTPAPSTGAVKTETIIEKVAYQDILSASTDIAFGGRITAENIQWKQWPEEAMSDQYISREDRPEALEEYLSGIAKAPIYEGEPITDRRVVLAGDKGLMSALLGPGMRAVTTDISTESAAGGFIQPGDRVDIILTTDVDVTPGMVQTSFEDRYESNTVFENVRVLAIDQTYAVSDESGAAITGSTATFEMSQADAELLQVAISAGEIALTLRPLTANGVGAGKSHSRLRKAKKTNPSISVYRGGQPELVAVRGN